MGPGTFSGYVVNLEFTFGFKSLEVDLKPNMFRGGLLSPTTPFMLAFRPPRIAEGPPTPLLLLTPPQMPPNGIPIFVNAIFNWSSPTGDNGVQWGPKKSKN